MSVLLIKHVKHSGSAAFLLLANISGVSHFLGFTPELFSLPTELRMVLRFLDVFQIVFIWFVALSLFDKGFRLNRFHLVVALVYSLAVLMERLVEFGFVSKLPHWWAWLVNGLSVLIVAHMISVTLTGRKDDLLESRRRSRVYFVLMIACSALSATILGSVLFNQYQPTIDVLSIWPAIVWGSHWLCDVPTTVFDFDNAKPDSTTRLNSRDSDLQAKLNLEVVDNKCFLENDLSIESLASRLGVSAYRLRGFINKTLGHTNFSTYINAYRIAEIKRAFCDPENNHVPILTIAMNHGFNSISPFNRAFKHVEGMTPKEFRQNLGTYP